MQIVAEKPNLTICHILVPALIMAVYQFIPVYLVGTDMCSFCF